MRAKKLLFLSHTLLSIKHAKGGMGEISNAQKLKRLINENYVSKVVDIYDLFSNSFHIFQKLSRLNYQLALEDEELIEETCLDEGIAVKKKIANLKPDVCFILSLNWSVAAFSFLGVQKLFPTVTKLYVHHEDERVLPQLYKPSTLLLTESLLASKKAIDAGIDPGKIIFLPNHYPKEFHKLKQNKNRLLNIARAQNKSWKINENTSVIGLVSRLEFGKNIEYALDALERLVHEGEDLLVYVKGHFDPNSLFRDYQKMLKKKLERLSKKPWFLWDSQYTISKQVFSLYEGIDVLVHLSGAEAGSNITTEFLGLGKPVILLDAHVNPSLYQDAAIFIKTDGFVKEALLPFALPDKNDVYEKLKALVGDKKKQKEMGKKALKIAKSRFSPERTLDRFPLILEAADSYFYNKPNQKKIKKKIEELYEKDRLADWP